MAEVAPAAAVAPPKVTKKKGTTPRKTGPSVSELILNIVAASKERNGVSAAALKKALAVGGYDVDKNKSRVRTAIKALVAKGSLVQTKGTGASGSLKMSKKAAEPKKVKKPAKKAALKAKKPVAATKTKTAAAKKPVAAKKSPKKAKKLTAAKKAAKSPKKGSKKTIDKVAKKTTAAKKAPVAKKPAAKKSPAKKAVKPKAKKAAAKKK
uniref:histone H1-like n=1 Tax=Epinephelus lanceolatus TaxID=310571 RepID=UPI0014482532|nr:histone H1-like [Epinephelus lanceolatus]